MKNEREYGMALRLLQRVADKLDGQKVPRNLTEIEALIDQWESANEPKVSERQEATECCPLCHGPKRRNPLVAGVQP